LHAEIRCGLKATIRRRNMFFWGFRTVCVGRRRRGQRETLGDKMNVKGIARLSQGKGTVKPGQSTAKHSKAQQSTAKHSKAALISQAQLGSRESGSKRRQEDEVSKEVETAANRDQEVECGNGRRIA